MFDELSSIEILESELHCDVVSTRFQMILYPSSPGHMSVLIDVIRNFPTAIVSYTNDESRKPHFHIILTFSSPKCKDEVAFLFRYIDDISLFIRPDEVLENE